VKNRPDIDEDEISQQTEADLAAYYEVGYSQEQSQTGVTDGGKHATGKATGTGRKQESVTRSEEEHVVTKLTVRRERVIIRRRPSPTSNPLKPSSARAHQRRHERRAGREFHGRPGVNDTPRRRMEEDELQIDKQQIIDMLRDQGDNDKAQEAEQELAAPGPTAAVRGQPEGVDKQAAQTVSTVMRRLLEKERCRAKVRRRHNFNAAHAPANSHGMGNDSD
jgi:hypothetical protein